MTEDKSNLRLQDNDAGLSSRLTHWGSHIVSMFLPLPDRMQNITMNHLQEPSALWWPRENGAG